MFKSVQLNREGLGLFTTGLHFCFSACVATCTTDGRAWGVGSGHARLASSHISKTCTIQNNCTAVWDLRM